MPGGAAPDPLTLPRTTIYLPTRRAGRALRDAFLEAGNGRAALLPRIRALGDPDEEAAIIFSAEADDDGDAGLGAPAIGEMERRLTLMRLILAWGRALRADAEAARSEMEGGVLWDITPAHASYLAADLARLMDFVESEEADLSALKGLVPESHAEHWQITVDFLKIVTEHWPAHLKQSGLVSPVARRDALMAFEAAHLVRSPPPGPVIAAGSTGTVPATARLLATIATLPNGAVVLPGLDMELDDESWSRVAEHPEHPQAGMAELLRKLGTTRADVRILPGSEPDADDRARLKLVSEALRPSDTTDHWQLVLGQGKAELGQGKPDFERALAGISLVEAPTAQDEAEAIALMMRSCIETKGKTAALVTPDRVLARRVAARLKGFDLAIDDSAGVPVARTVSGAFLDLILGAVETGFAPPELMALLKHPLCLLGRSAAEVRSAARALERGAFRDIYVGQGLAGAAAALTPPPDDSERRRIRLGTEEVSDALALVKDLEAAFEPLMELFARASPQAISRFAEAHGDVAEALARDQSGASSGVWRGDAGEALSILLAELTARSANVPIGASDYPSFYRSLVSGEVVRPRLSAHPRLFIWGPLEARLQQPDVVILGGLNEGVWPQPQDAGPWLSRPMRRELNLPPPERRIGLAAHDFAQSLCARHVYLTRALKVDGVPTVASRWLQRLLALVEGTGLAQAIAPAQPWLPWARERDVVAEFAPASAPCPRPPIEARPRKLSVSGIERWIANPYEIYARYILGLQPLEPLGKEPDAALRGQIVHAALHDFAKAYPRDLPGDIRGALITIADRYFAKLRGAPLVEAFWRPQLERFARWFAGTEPARRAGTRATHTELQGSMTLEAGAGFTVTARADRIDSLGDGSVVIYDYKTGTPPSANTVAALLAPQLPLEAAIAACGGFAGLDGSAELGGSVVRGIRYIHASGRHEGGEEQVAAAGDPAALATLAVEALVTLVERFDRVDTPYEAKRRPHTAFRSAYRFDQYEHLARLKEWATAPAEDDAG
jgi:ATP-dependent helicase/nuclease subunit B